MANSVQRRSRWNVATLSLLGTVALLLAAPFVTAQTAQDKDAAKAVKDPGQDDKKVKDQIQIEELTNAPRVKSGLPLLSGYTRPGNPNDIDKDGKIIFVANDPAFKGRLIGGTVYFAVYERPAFAPVVGDSFATGVSSFDEFFREGRGTNGVFSPGLDTTAKYLYVYQVVNDRGLDPPEKGIAFAGYPNPRTEDIVTTTVKLQVDPREITSWGHFANMGFSSKVADKTMRGAEVAADVGGSPRMLQLACSSSPGILSALPFHEYKSISPAFPLRGLKQSFVIDRSNLNLKSAKARGWLSSSTTKTLFLGKKTWSRMPTAGWAVQIVLPEPQRYGSLPAFAVGPDVLQEVGDNQPEQQPVLQGRLAGGQNHQARRSQRYFWFY